MYVLYVEIHVLRSTALLSASASVTVETLVDRPKLHDHLVVVPNLSTRDLLPYSCHCMIVPVRSNGRPIRASPTNHVITFAAPRGPQRIQSFGPTLPDQWFFPRAASRLPPSSPAYLRPPVLLYMAIQSAVLSLVACESQSRRSQRIEAVNEVISSVGKSSSPAQHSLGCHGCR